MIFKSVDQAVRLGPNEYDMDNLVNLITDIDNALHNGQFVELQDYMLNIPKNLLSTQVLVTMLRSMCCARDKMPRWAELVQQVRDVLVSRNVDNVDRVLVNL